jgi:hypothetical protein
MQKELLRTALDRHPDQSPTEILEQAPSERIQRKMAISPLQPKRAGEDFQSWLQQFTALSERIPSMPGETFSREMIYQDRD